MNNCIECGKLVDVKAGEEIQTNIGTMRLGSEKPNLCRRCFSEGWSDDSQEVAEGIADDPELSRGVSRVSPIQPEDL
jgi:hypothetical protein